MLFVINNELGAQYLKECNFFFKKDEETNNAIKKKKIKC